MTTTVYIGDIMNSTTLEQLNACLNRAIERTHSPFKKRAMLISKCFYACCGAHGLSRQNLSCCTNFQKKSIKFMSRALSGCAIVD